MLSSKLTYLLQIVFGVCILYFLGCSFYLGYITANLIKEGLTISSEVFILPLFHLTWIRTLALLFAFSYGCFAVLKRTPKYMKTFAFIVLSSTILQVAYDFIYFSTKTAEIEYNVRHFELPEFRTLDSDTQLFIQSVQQEHRCCGVQSANDYGLELNKIPNSCCGKFNAETGSSHGTGLCLRTDLYGVGCESRFNEYFRYRYFSIFEDIINYALYVSDAMAVILGMTLFKVFDDQKNTLKTSQSFLMTRY